MTRRILPLLLAIVLAGLGTAAVLAYVATADARALAGKQAVTVLLAKERIPAGTPAGQVRSERFVEQVRMPAEAVPVGALGSIGGEFESLVILADVLPSQMLLRGHFGAEKKAAVGLPVPDGKIAVTVQLTTPAAVAGYVLPGSKIVILDTYDVPAAVPGQEAKGTRVLLPKVEVIAVGTYGLDAITDAPEPAPSGDAEGSGAAEGSGTAAPKASGLLMLTVAVTQAEAEKLVHGTQTGVLYLGLLTDSTVVKTGPGVDDKSVFK